jgi:hypothetical protein
VEEKEDVMSRMHLPEVEVHHGGSPWGEAAHMLELAGLPVPRILHLFDYKPQWTRFLAEFTQCVMRGPSPLTSGQRELIAAFTSRLNHCHF